MSKTVLVLLLALAAAPAVAQSPTSEPPTTPRIVYGSGLGMLDGKVTMNVGTGNPGGCGTKLWYHDPHLVLKRERAGTCVVNGAGTRVPQYKITFIEDTPEERAEVK